MKIRYIKIEVYEKQKEEMKKTYAYSGPLDIVRMHKLLEMLKRFLKQDDEL